MWPSADWRVTGALRGTISQRVLTLSLRSLGRDEMVTHTVTPSIPPRADCAFAPLGASLQGPVSASGEWASANADASTRFEAVKC